MSKVITQRDLPPGWRWIKLGELCELQYGSGLVEAAREDGTVPVYGSNGIVGYHNKSITQGPTIIIGRKGSVGQVHYSTIPCFPIDTTYYIDSGKEPTDLVWLAFILSILDLPGLNKASGVPGLNRNDVYKQLLPLPPLPEQQRIAALLKEQLAAVDKARLAAQARLEAVKALPAAYLRQVFPQPGQSLPPGWRWVKLGDVCDFLDNRRLPVSETERAKRIEGKAKSELYPYYGANGQTGWIDSYIFDEPLILLAEDGGAFGSADTPISYKIEGKTWVNNHAHVLKPHDGVDFDFCLSSISIRPDVGKIVTGNTRPKLNQALAAGIQLPIPPLAEQQRITILLKEQLAAVDKARLAAKSELATINALPAALLRRAFNGEL